MIDVYYCVVMYYLLMFLICRMFYVIQSFIIYVWLESFFFVKTSDGKSSVKGVEQITSQFSWYSREWYILFQSVWNVNNYLINISISLSNSNSFNISALGKVKIIKHCCDCLINLTNCTNACLFFSNYKYIDCQINYYCMWSHATTPLLKYVFMK